MPKSDLNVVDISRLSDAQRREVRALVQALLVQALDAGKAEPGYRFRDLCGTMAWKGDAVAAQRRLREEW